MILHGNAWVQDPATGQFLAERLETASTYGQAGQMKLPHALSMHAMQVLPLLAFLMLFSSWGEKRRTALMASATIGYTGLLAVGCFQTYTGLAPTNLEPLVAAAALVGAALLFYPYAATLRELARTS